MIENYNKARKYLYKIDSNLYKDVLHDAYLNYFRRTGLNLFERSNTNVIGVVKNQYFETLRKGMFKKNGVRQPFQFTEFEDHRYTSTTPEDILIGEEALSSIKNRIRTFEKPEIATAVLDLRYGGYSTEEISEQLGLSTLQVNRYTQNLKRDRVGKNRISKNEREEIFKLREEGLTLNQISVRVGRAMPTVWLTLNNKVCR